jgi:hypothetical protein
MTKVRRPKLTLRAFNIANKIRERRVANGLTLNDMSRLTGQSVANCRAWEKQFGPQCEEKHLGSICRALSAKRSELTGDISDDNNPLDESLVRVPAHQLFCNAMINKG